MNNSFRVIFEKVLIKVNIIKIYSIDVHIITIECSNIRIYIIKESISSSAKIKVLSF